MIHTATVTAETALVVFSYSGFQSRAHTSINIRHFTIATPQTSRRDEILSLFSLLHHLIAATVGFFYVYAVTFAPFAAAIVIIA